MWNKVFNFEVRYGKVSKNEYVEILQEFSFNVPPLTDRLNFLANKFQTTDRDDSKKWLNNKQYYLAIIISTLKYSEMDEAEEIVTKCLNDIYRYCFENGLVTKFIDYVLSNDFGKAIYFFNSDFIDRELWKKIIESPYFNKSDEFSSLLIKLCTTTDGKKFLSNINYKFNLSIILQLIDATKGKTGGLLRNCYFAVRRDPQESYILTSDRSNEDNLISFIGLKIQNDVNAYSVVMLVSRAIYINLTYIVNVFVSERPELAKMIAASLAFPLLIWGEMQQKLLTSGGKKYNEESLLADNLYDFYKKLSSNEVEDGLSNQQETIGVILTTYNPNVELLELSMASILKQSYSNLRLCIVDDCSNKNVQDEIKKVVNKFNDTRIEFISNETNVGQYKSRNIAMEKLQGCEFYAIQDDDDISHPQRLEYQLKSLTKNNAQLNMCQQVRFTLNLSYVPDKVNPFEFDFGPASSFFRASVIKQVGGFADVRSRGDVEFITRITNHYGASAIDKLAMPMYVMRCDLSTVSAMKDRYLKTQLDVFRLQMSRGDVERCIQGQQFALSTN